MNPNADLVYYDACIFGGSVAGWKPMIFTDTRTDPLIFNTGLYKMSIVQATIPTSYIPIRVMEIEQGDNTDINKTIYKIRLKRGDITVEKNIIWNTEININERPMEVPNRVYKGGIVDTQFYTYYALRCFQHMAMLINETLTELFNELTGFDPSIMATTPPYWVYDSISGLFKIYVQMDYINDNIDMAFNINLFTFFLNSFKFIFGPNAPNSFMTFDFTGYNKFEILNNTTYDDYVIFTQEVRTQQKFYSGSGFRSIEIVSPTLGINNENIQLQDAKGDAITTSSAENAILNDFHVNIETGSELRGYIIYNPTAQYRYVSFKTNKILNKIDFMINWVDNYGNRMPIFIPLAETCQLKFVFEKIK
jgi:hypothetical protein